MYTIYSLLFYLYCVSASYFYPIVEFLVQNLSYVRGKNIRGAPYDFRKAPSKLIHLLLKCSLKHSAYVVEQWVCWTTDVVCLQAYTHVAFSISANISFAVALIFNFVAVSQTPAEAPGHLRLVACQFISKLLLLPYWYLVTDKFYLAARSWTHKPIYKSKVNMLNQAIAERVTV